MPGANMELARGLRTGLLVSGRGIKELVMSMGNGVYVLAMLPITAIFPYFFHLDQERGFDVSSLENSIF